MPRMPQTIKDKELQQLYESFILTLIEMNYYFIFPGPVGTEKPAFVTTQPEEMGTANHH
jgi:hypothetical protein